MDLLLQLLGLLAIIFFYKLCFSWTSNKRNHAPEPPGAWPIIGHLHLLRGNEPLFRTLGAMADRFGPVFSLRLGMKQMMVVSSWEVAKECFTVNDMALANRPTSTFGKYMTYDYAMMGVAPYGPYWRDLRKIATLHLLSSARLEALKHVPAMEIDAQMKELHVMWVENHQSPITVEMRQWFKDLLFNMIVRMVIGKKLGSTNAAGANEETDDRRFRRAIADFNRLVREFVPSDVLPFLDWLDWEGHKSAMKKTFKELDTFIVKLLEEHRSKRVDGQSVGQEDFMDVMLSIVEETQFSNYDPDTIVKATCLALIVAGTDTTANVLAEILSLLLSNRRVLKKAQDELDANIGRDRLADKSNTKNLVYLQAIIKEALRLSQAGSLSLSRMAAEDCRIGGFDVPASTLVLVNLWKLHQDPRIWSDASKFQPERFLNSNANMDIRGQHFELIPFGSGRRSCPGISLALEVMQLTLACFLQGFELATAMEGQCSRSERAELSGSIAKTEPLKILLIPRLPLKLYD